MLYLHKKNTIKLQTKPDLDSPHFTAHNLEEHSCGLPGGWRPGGGRENPGGGTEKSIPPISIEKNIFRLHK